MTHKPCRCGYKAPPEAKACPACGADISSVPAREEAAPPRRPIAPYAAILLFVAAVISFQFWKGAWPKPPAPADEQAKAREFEEATFAWQGLIYTLEQMGRLRYLPEEEEARIYSALKHKNPGVRLAALNAGYLRLNSFRSDPERFKLLIPLIKDPAPEVRSSAAINMAATIGNQGYLADAAGPWKKDILALASDPDEKTRAFGGFLAALSGALPPDALESGARSAFASDVSPLAKLYAACTLLRLGRGEFLSYMKGPFTAELEKEAAFCLAYSEAPGTDKTLWRLATSTDREETTNAAMTSLKFREQLAIIKRKGR